MDNYFPNILLISGSGRNVGKTTFTCRTIKAFSRLGIVAVKISPHWHIQNESKKTLLKEENTLLLEELNTGGDKDSSRMLRSGAARVYYIQNLADTGLLKAFKIIMKREGKKRPMIFESAALGKYITPAIHLHINRPVQDGDKVVPANGSIDRFINFDGREFDFSPGSLSWEENSWSMISSINP